MTTTSTSNQQNDQEEQLRASHSINVHLNSETSATWEPVCRAFAQSGVLSNVSIGFGMFSETLDMSLLRRALETNTTVERLELTRHSSVFRLDITEALHGLALNTTVKNCTLRGWLFSSEAAMHALVNLLTTNTTLTALELSIHGHTIQLVCDALAYSTSLQDIAIMLENSVSVRQLGHLRALLQHTTAIRVLKLSTPFPAMEVSSAIEGMLFNKSVQKLELSEACVVSGAVIRTVLENNRSLQEVSIAVRNEDDISQLASGLVNNHTLHTLDIDFRGLFHNSIAMSLARILSVVGTCALKSLRLRSGPSDWARPVTREAISLIQASLQQKTLLRDLQIILRPGRQEEHGCPEVLLDAILPGLCGESSSVDSLRLVGLWGSLNHTRLARFLCNKHSLKSLYVESCNLGNVGIDAIARGIRINPQLQALHAQYNDITSVTELVSMLSERSCLEKLDLSRNYLGNTRTAVLFAALPNTKSLKTLELYDCGIGDGGLHSIAETLPQTGLTSIVLGRNRIGDSGAIALGKVLPKMSLKSISLDGNRIGHQGVRALLAGVELSTTIESFSGLPAAFGVGQMKVAFHTSQNRSEWKSFLTQDNMMDDDWVSGVQAMGNNGGLSAAFAALQARPDFVFQRADVIV